MNAYVGTVLYLSMDPTKTVGLYLLRKARPSADSHTHSFLQHREQLPLSVVRVGAGRVLLLSVHDCLQHTLQNWKADPVALAFRHQL